MATSSTSKPAAKKPAAKPAGFSVTSGNSGAGKPHTAPGATIDDQRERDAVVEDLAGEQERGANTDAPPPRVSPGYIHATNPAGIKVTFVPGENLPEWAAEALKKGRARVVYP